MMYAAIKLWSEISPNDELFSLIWQNKFRHAESGRRVKLGGLVSGRGLASRVRTVSVKDLTGVDLSRGNV
jgi:hypothetical protein